MKTEMHADPSSPRTEAGASVRATWHSTLWKVLAGFIPLFLILQYGPVLLLPLLGSPWHVLVPAAVMLGLALGFERWFFGNRPRQGLRQLGYGRPGWRAVIVALLLTAIMLLFFPVLSQVSGMRLSLNPDWLPTLIGIIAFNGLAEETLFRGYAFGHLRQNSSFLRAGFISLLLFAGAHLFLFLGNPFIVALAATLVAVTSAFPMAHLFERGRGTLWAPVIVHAGTHAIRLVDIPDGLYITAVTAWLGMQIFLPLLVFAFRRYLRGSPEN
jgi:membrane protease YdiL (CAAX protease family)